MTRPAPRRSTRWALSVWVATSGFSIVAAQIAGALAAGAWLVGVARGCTAARLPLLVPWIAFLTLSLASALASPDPGAGLVALRGEWLPLVLFLACVNALSDEAPGRGRWAWALTVSGAAMALAGILQVAIRGTAFRASGTLGHYMTYSGVLLVALVVTSALALYESGARNRRWAAAAAATMLVALLLGQTRGAWLGLLAGLAVLAWLRDRRLLLALPLVGVALVLAAPGPARARVLALLRVEDVTAHERIFLWRAGAHVVADHPRVGSGPGQLERLWEHYRLPDDPAPRDRPFSHLHSNPMQIAAERGVPALLAWLWLWLAWLRDATNGWRATPATPARGRALVAGGIAALVAFHVAGLTEYNYGDTEVLYVATFAMALPYLGAAGDVCAPRESASGNEARR